MGAKVGGAISFYLFIWNIYALICSLNTVQVNLHMNIFVNMCIHEYLQLQSLRPLAASQKAVSFLFVYMNMFINMLHSPLTPTNWVEHPSPVLGIEGFRISQVRMLVESNQWLKNVSLLLPSLTLGIGQGLVGSVSGYQVMVLMAWYPTVPVGQHYKVAMKVRCQ